MKDTLAWKAVMHSNFIIMRSERVGFDISQRTCARGPLEIESRKWFLRWLYISTQAGRAYANVVASKVDYKVLILKIRHELIDLSGLADLLSKSCITDFLDVRLGVGRSRFCKIISKIGNLYLPLAHTPGDYIINSRHGQTLLIR